MTNNNDRLDKEQICQPGFSTPQDAPTIPPFPFTFKNANIFTAVWRSDMDSITRLIPKPLEPVNDIVLCHIYDMKDTQWLGHYQESNVMVSAKLPDTEYTGGFSTHLYLSSEIGVAHGREIHGQPKKLGQPKVEFRQDLIVGSVDRNGIEIITATMPYKQHEGSLDNLKKLMPFDTNLNLKAIDHIDGTPAIRQLTARKLDSVTIHECWSGTGTVELRPNAQAPLYRLPVIEMLDNYFWRADFTLVAGKIIYDYLLEK